MSIIANTLEGLELGNAVVHENLAVFPLLGGKRGAAPYDTLREAPQAGTVTVTAKAAASARIAPRDTRSRAGGFVHPGPSAGGGEKPHQPVFNLDLPSGD